MTAVAALAGCLAAAGLILLAWELRPAPPPLDATLARLQAVPFQSAPALNENAAAAERVGRWLAERVARPAGLLVVPRTDLALLGRPIERFMLHKLALLFTGLAAPGVLTGLIVAAGGSVPWALPTLGALALGLVLALVPDWSVRSRARARRREFRYAFACYLQLVVLERQAGAALNAALEEPSTITDGWPFQRLHRALTRARRTQQQPWRALAALGEDIGVADLTDLAHTSEIAGAQGAKIHDVLVAKITSLRHEAAAAARAEAGARTTAMWVPTCLLMLGFVILVGFPFFSKLLESG